MSRPVPTRYSLPMTEALAQSAPLALLLQRMQESQARYAVVHGDLPGTLAGQVAPGPLDDSGWTLLARSGAAAAKLRQCVPRLQERLREHGWAVLEIRVKVHVSRGV
jgi:hypothetical protein